MSKRQTQASDEIEQIAATLVRCLEAIGEPTPGNRLFEERVATDAAETLGCVCCILDEAKALNNPAAREALDAVGLAIHAHLLTLDPTAKVGNLQRVLDDLTLRVVELVDVRDNDDDGHEYEMTGWEP